MNVNLLLLPPLLTILGVLAATSPRAVRWFSLAGSLVQLLAAIALCVVYVLRRAHESSAFLFVYRMEWYGPLQMTYRLGVDGTAVALILLTAVVVLAGVLISWNVDHRPKEFHSQLALMAAGAYGFFMSLDMFTMFFFLELAVIPKFLLISVWGSGQKHYSANKLALMLMAASVLILVGILGIYFYGNKTFDLLYLAAHPLPQEVQLRLFPLLFIGFGVFTGLFPFHTWIPDGHSSAPTAGSMFLAGISMKLGGFGCLRLVSLLMPAAAAYYAEWIIGLATVAILYGAFATLMQTDLKYMNAYSSVSHCGFVLLGIGMLNQTAWNGAVLQMISHGLMTALFFAVIGMIYERTHTRTIAAMGGLMKSMPFIMTALYVAGLCSLGLPGLSGFVSEVTVFVGAWTHEDVFRRIAVIAACASIVVTATYILRAIGQVAMGPLKQADLTISIGRARWNERWAALLLMAGIVFIGMLPSYLLELIAPNGTELPGSRLAAEWLALFPNE